MRLFTWVGLPFGHTGGRYSNGNYSVFNQRARRELAAIRELGGAARRGAAPHVRMVDFPVLGYPGTYTPHFACF